MVRRTRYALARARPGQLNYASGNVGSTADAYAAVMRDNNARLGKVIRDAGTEAE